MNIIDLQAIAQNAEYFLNVLGDSKLCAVLKNNAYGHGLVKVALKLAPIAHMFAVGCTDEAEKIAFINKDVLILLPQNKRQIECAIRHGFILTVDSFFTLQTILSVAKNVNRVARVHVKIDSGMSRLGFTRQDMPTLLSVIHNPFVSVEGVFSHFYGESVFECDAQLKAFKSCVVFLDAAYPNLIHHIANTAGVLLSSKYHLDMARIGIGLYGYGCNALVPAKKVLAEVIAVKSLASGSVVGYGARYHCEKQTNIAVLSIGYASGFPRRLVGAKVKIGDYFFPVVAVCMAMIIVDTGDIKVKIGDIAHILGDGVNIANEEVIVYELLCNL